MIEQSKTWWCGSAGGCGNASGGSSMRRTSSSVGSRGAYDGTRLDGTNIEASARRAGVRERGTAAMAVRWGCTHATQRRHGRDSGGTVAVARGARAIASIGPGIRSRITKLATYRMGAARTLGARLRYRVASEPHLHAAARRRGGGTRTAATRATLSAARAPTRRTRCACSSRSD